MAQVPLQKIVVPLDGTRGAERAIAVAARMARTSGSTLLFIRVVLPPAALDKPTIHSTRMWERPAFEAARARACNYLVGVLLNYAGELAGVKAEIDVASGLVPAAICATAEREHADLIMMCSHGMHGLKRWFFGGIAREITRKSALPVLVFNERGSLISASHGAQLV